jgi:hypothetical protein
LPGIQRLAGILEQNRPDWPGEKTQRFESRLNFDSLCDTYPSTFGTLGYAYVGRCEADLLAMDVCRKVDLLRSGCGTPAIKIPDVLAY